MNIMDYWQIKILIFISFLHMGYPESYRIEPPVVSEVFKSTTTEKPRPIINKHFFIHSFPEDEILSYNKPRRPNYRIFFITLPKLLDSKAKFATQTSDGTLVYIVNKKDKDDNDLITLQRPTTITPKLSTTTSTTTTRTTPKPIKLDRIFIKHEQLSTTSTTQKPEFEPTHESEPEIITAPDIESDEDQHYHDNHSELSTNIKYPEDSENNDEYSDETGDSYV